MTAVACIFRLVRYIGNALPAAAAGSASREVSPEFAPGHETAFADGFPILLATEVCRSIPEPPILRCIACTSTYGTFHFSSCTTAGSG